MNKPEAYIRPTIPLNAFNRLARNLQAGDIDFSRNDDGSGEPDGLDVEKLIEERPRDLANSVSSRVVHDKFRSTDGDPLAFNGYQPSGMHKVVIDLDMDAALIPTSTPGHHHLIIEHQMPWEAYRELLIALNKAGLIQDGYLNASLQREASWIRTPWTLK